MQPPNKPEPARGKPPKEGELKVRADLDTIKQAKEKADRMGWSLSSVVRALLRLWISEDVISSSDVGAEKERAPRRGKKKRKPAAPAKKK